jgi:hypothetical protein
MRQLKTIGLALFALAMLGGLAASEAGAEEGLLPTVTAKTFKLSGGAATLETLAGESLSCTGMSGEGTVAVKLDQKATGTITLTGCKFNGFAVNTLGAASGTIVSAVNFLVCLINSAQLVFGVVIEPKETVHVEVPTLKVLILVKGAVIADNLSPNKGTAFEFDLVGSKGDQTTALSCEINGKTFKHTFELGIDSKADSDASENAKATVTYGVEVELMDS